MSNKPNPNRNASKRTVPPRPGTAKRSGVSSRAVLYVVGALVVVAAIIAIVVSATSDSADAGPQTRPVEVTGAALPRYDGSVPADAAVGSAAPEVRGSSFADEPVGITNDGRPKLVMFLAHWCPHCRAEVPVITDWLADRGMPDDVDLYSVATGTNADAPNYPPSKWLEDEDWPITTLVDDADSTTGAAFGLSSYPYFVAIGADGAVVARASGELPTDQIEALMTAAAAG